jgi:hypothetical protein
MQAPIRVECYSGHTYAQEPRAFEWEGRRYDVERIVKRWRTPGGPCFRVEVARSSNLPQPAPACRPGQAGASQGGQSPISNLFDLTYLESTDQWTMTVQT